jgi:DNA-binding protein H-NS
MAKTLAQIRQQIEKLEKEAKSVRAKEVAGVIGRIREAIESYSLTAEDLFGTKVNKASRPKRTAGGALKKVAKKKSAMAKFKDPSSNKTWTGHGKRPGWFVDAVASGKTAEELAIGA